MPAPWEKYKSVAKEQSEGPWAKYQAEQKPDENLDPQAALSGFGQAATLGYLPQLQAAAAPIITKGMDIIKGTDQYKDLPSYVERRDAASKQLEQYAEKSPVSYYGGQVAGTLATGPLLAAKLPIVGGMKAGGLLARTAQGVGAGAIVGAAQNPGDVEGRIDPLQTEKRIEGAKMGGLLGGATTAGAEMLGKVGGLLSKIPTTLKGQAEIKAVKSAGAMKADFKKLAQNNRVSSLGRTILDEGLIKPGDTINTIERRSGLIKDKIGSQIGKMYEVLDDQVATKAPSLAPSAIKEIQDATINPQKIASELESVFKKELGGRAGSTAVLSKVQGYLDEIKLNGDNLTFPKALELKNSFDDLINYHKRYEDLPGIQKALLTVRNKIRDEMNNQISTLDKHIGGESLAAIKKLNSKYGNVAEVNRMAKNKMAAENANAMMGLRETLFGAAGMSAGGVIGGVQSGDLEGAVKGGLIGLGAAGAARLGRTYGVPVYMKALDTAGKLADANPVQFNKVALKLSSLARKNPAAAATMINQLANQPEFKAKEEEK